MINVLYISHYPDLKMGGQQSMLALIKNLDRTKINPFAIVPNYGELYDRLSELSCKVFVVPLTALKPKFLMKQISNLFAIRKIILQNKIDIIHPDHERDSIIGGIAKIKTSAKMVWHVRLTRSVSTDSLSVKLSDGIIGISSDVKLRFPKPDLIEHKYRTIFNGVDCEVFIPTNSKKSLRKECNIAEDAFVVLYVGQFKVGKGVLDLIKSALFLKQGFSNIKILMVGTSENSSFRKIMDELVKDNHLENIIEILQQQTNIHKIMQASDILVLPSHEGTEGMGRVLFEAMACGTPVIGTDVKGVREAITLETGLLVKEKNPQDLFEAISKYFKDEKFRISAGIEGRKRALEFFDIKVHSRNVEEFYFDFLKIRR